MESLLKKCPDCDHMYSIRTDSCPMCEGQPSDACKICQKVIPKDPETCPLCGDSRPYEQHRTTKEIFEVFNSYGNKSDSPDESKATADRVEEIQVEPTAKTGIIRRWLAMIMAK